MKKRILALLLSVLFILGTSSVTMAAEAEPVTAIDGTVTIEATTTAEEGTPVLLFILPAIFDGGEDITVEKVAAAKTKSNFDGLNIEYLTAVLVGANGKIQHSCQMNDDLDTGLCQVIVSYIGSEESVYSIGTFEHVGREDVTALLEALNDSDATSCGAVIDADINGEIDETDGDTRLPAKEILRKSSADTEYYETLTDKTAFHQVYYLKKGAVDFTSTTMVTAFNEAAAWIKLRNEADTLNVLKTYNGETDGKYWSLPLDDASDFAKLGDKQTAVLAKIKAGGYTDKAVLEADFHNLVLISIFRSLETREELESMISTTSPYAADFAGVREILADASLDEAELLDVYTAVLKAKDQCETIQDVEALFTNSLPEDLPGDEEGENEGDDDDAGNSYGGGVPMGAGGKAPVIKNDSTMHPTNPENPNAGGFPFRDVAENHWAKDYITKLYEKGAINGVAEGTFNAGGNVYRQDFVKILVGAMGISVTDSKSVFGDVPEDAYYTKFVMTAYENGLIQGVGDGFGVGTSISRQDAAVILSRVLAKYGVNASTNAASFADGGAIADYAKEAVAIVSAAGIFGGDEQGNFNPKAELSRAEACAILCRLAEMIGEV